VEGYWQKSSVCLERSQRNELPISALSYKSSTIKVNFTCYSRIICSTQITLLVYTWTFILAVYCVICADGCCCSWAIHTTRRHHLGACRSLGGRRKVAHTHTHTARHGTARRASNGAGLVSSARPAAHYTTDLTVSVVYEHPLSSTLSRDGIIAHSSSVLATDIKYSL